MQRFFTLIVLFAVIISFTAFGQDNTDSQPIILRDNARLGGARGSLQFLLGGHIRNIRCVDWSPDGSKVITASDENNAIIWSSSTGSIITILHSFIGSPTTIRWSPDGSKIVSTHDGGRSFIVWDVLTGLPVFTFSDTKPKFHYIEWSSDGTKFITSGWTDTVSIWEASTGKRLKSLIGNMKYLGYVKWSPSSLKIVTTCADSTAIVWSATTGDSLFTLKGHTGFLQDADWSPDGEKIITTSSDSTSKIWSATTGALLFTLKGQKQEVIGARWNNNSTKIITTGSKDNIIVWDAISGTMLTKIDSIPYISNVEWSPDGSKFSNGKDIWATVGGTPKRTMNVLYLGFPVFNLYSGSTIVTKIYDYPIFKWDPTSTKIITANINNSTNIWSATDGSTLVSLKSNVMPAVIDEMCWSPDGSKIASICKLTDSTTLIAVWSTLTATRLFTIKSGPIGFYDKLVWSPDGTKIATIHKKVAIIWSAVTGQKIYSLVGHIDSIDNLSWSPDGTMILTNINESSTDDPTYFWSATDGQLIKKLRSIFGEYYFCWNKNGTQTLSTNAGAGRIRNVSKWEVINSFSYNGSHDFEAPISWNPNGNSVVANSLVNPPSIWDIASGNKLFTLGDQYDVNKIEFSADGSKVYTLESKKTPYIWSTTTGSKLCTLDEHKNLVLNLAWSPNSTTIASAIDGQVVIWSAVTGKKVYTIEEESSIVKWSPSGNRLATTNTFDGNILIWYADDITSVQETPITPPPNTFTIYPNPASNQFTLHFEQATHAELTLYLMNMLGQTVAEIVLPTGCTEQIIPTESLPVGMYIAKVNSIVQPMMKW